MAAQGTHWTRNRQNERLDSTPRLILHEQLSVEAFTYQTHRISLMFLSGPDSFDSRVANPKEDEISEHRM